MFPETNMTYENDYRKKTGNTDVNRAGLGSMKVLSLSVHSHSRFQSHNSTIQDCDRYMINGNLSIC
jgi:hypothetical protein